MKCDFCGRDLSEDSTYKRAIASQMGCKKREEKVFCDGPTLSEAGQMGLDVRTIPINPNSQERKKYADFRLCAQIYKESKAIQGFSVIINVEQA